MMKLGLSEKDYLALFNAQILERKVRAAIEAEVPSTQKQVWARHILVADEAAANKVVERLKNGEDFAALAQELSSDTGSAVKGGDLGWFASGAMVPEFETAAFALEKPGDYTATPVKSQFGYHIIKVEGRREARHPSFAEVKDQLREDLTKEKGLARYQDYLKGLRQKAKLTINLK